MTAGDIERLPIPRDPNAVVLMAPGAVYGDTAFGTNNRREHYGTGFGYASLGGASVAENIYYINGMNVTNFRNGLGASTVPFEFYDQFQLKTGGFGAEFGRATGGASSTRSRNEARTSGSSPSAATTSPTRCGATCPTSNTHRVGAVTDSADGLDEKDDFDLFLTAGGPAIEDRLFVYGIYDFRALDERNFDASGRMHEDINDDGFWGIKLDWLISDNHRIEYTGFSDDRTVRRTSFRWDESTGAVGRETGRTRFDRGGVNHIFAYRGYFGPRVAASGLWGTGDYDLNTESPEDATCPLAFDSRTVGFRQIGCWSNLLATGARDEREVARVDIEWAVGEQHLLRFGADREMKTSFDLVQYSGGEYYRYFNVVPGTVLNNGGIVPEGVTEAVRYRQYVNGGHFDAIASAYYIEDEWLITPINATLRLGLRNERFDNRNAEGRTFIPHNGPVSRHESGSRGTRGGDGTGKVFANYGRYHLPICHHSECSPSRVRRCSRRTGSYSRNQSRRMAAPLFGTRIGEKIVFADGSSRDVRTVVDRDIEPMAQDEYVPRLRVAGLRRLRCQRVVHTTEISRRASKTSLPTRRSAYVASSTTSSPIPAGTSAHTTIWTGTARSRKITLSAEDLGYPSMKRRYKAMTLDLKRPWDGVFYLRGAYTLSHSYGNYEGDGSKRPWTGLDGHHVPSSTSSASWRERTATCPTTAATWSRSGVWWQLRDAWQASAAFQFSSGRPRNAFGLHPTDRHAPPVRFVVVLPTGHTGATRYVGNDGRHLPARPRAQIHPRGILRRRSDCSTRRLQRLRFRCRDGGRRTRPTSGAAVDPHPLSACRSGSSSRGPCASGCSSVFSEGTGGLPPLVEPDGAVLLKGFEQSPGIVVDKGLRRGVPGARNPRPGRGVDTPAAC